MKIVTSIVSLLLMIPEPNNPMPSSAAAAAAGSAPTMEESRAVYQAGYTTQRRGSFRTACPYPLGSWQAKAWDQGYMHAAYAERHGLTHLHLPNDGHQLTAPRATESQ